MAVDQALFEAHAAGMGQPVVRVYDWEGPALTVGRLQDIEKASAAFPGVACIRRPTGGRAVLHGEDLTISVVMREELLRPLLATSGVLACYHLLVQPIIETASEYGVCLQMGRDSRRRDRDQDCFAHTAACDLIDRSTGMKALGAAQLRGQGTILQQMSLRPLQNVEILGAQFQSRLRHNFQQVLQVRGWRLENELREDEQVRARQIIETIKSESSRVNGLPFDQGDQ